LRHRHILVDEYQDVNRACGRLLKAIAGDGKRLWVVGDARQSIYRFRGASSANMALFAQDYPGRDTDQLNLNYRSTEQVVKSFMAVAPHMGASQGMLPLALTADRGSGSAKLQVRKYDTPDQEAAGIAASIKELESQGVALRNQAVLCRSNSRLNAIAAALEARSVPVLHLGSLFEREEIRDLLSLLSLGVDPYGAALMRVAAMPRYKISLQDVYGATQYLRTGGHVPPKGLAALVEAPGISNEGKIAFTKLAIDIAGFERSVTAWDFLSSFLLDRTDFVRDLACATTVAERMRAVAIWQFLNFVREQSPTGSGLPIHRTLDRVRQLVLMSEERDLRQVPAAALHLQAVKLMTVHGSKGLEFEAVHIPGLTVQGFPLANRGLICPPPVGMIEGTGGLSVKDEAKIAHEHEEQCLFFVALSRARTHLRLYLARKQADGKTNRSPSPFLTWLPAGMTQEIPSPQMLPLPVNARRPEPVRVTHGPSWKVTDRRLVDYERCPRRFLYTHVLSLGGARKKTAFSETHDCLYELLRWLATARKAGDPTFEEADTAFELIWQENGPIKHAYREDYRRLAGRIVRALIRAGAGRAFVQSEPLAIDFTNGRVTVEPSEIAKMPDGTVVLRRVRTGRVRSKEYDNLEYTLYILAARSKFGARAEVRALHLTDETEEAVTVTDAKISARTKKSEGMLAEIMTGLYPPEIDTVTCPRCPHFFFCASVPSGPIALP
jgi:DNA helicase II / ATP-dependent DNA helicase PcrA